MKKISIIGLALLFCSCFAFSQNNFTSTTLCNFIRKNFDSSIVLAMGERAGNFQIISHLNNSSFYFSYCNPYEWTLGYEFPLEVKTKLVEEYSAFYKHVPDTNRYFLPRRVDYQQRNQNWLDFNQLNLWNLQGDPQKTDTCTKKYDIMDGGSYRFYLITKTQTRTLDFYAPGFYEESCPGNKNRQAAIAVLRIFHSAFGSF